MSRNSAREEAIFSDALLRPEAHRAAFLDTVCGDDRTLRARVMALLAAHAHSDSLGMLATSNFPAPPEEKCGDVLGRYKLLQKIGEGGCGVVWMAEQSEPVRRRVALKVIKLGMDTREVIARFSAERQALAMMDHPGIAKVLDAGSTDAGRPYFVMELVRGVRITTFCDDQKLNLAARLELFVQVCHAVHHAHQKGIIHRDLKPSNILVSFVESVATAKVIDFGIAKAIQGRLTDQTLFTADNQFIGTPAYMSPEQADTGGLDIDTRSDVYSLGVLLYELLAGKCPFDPASLDSPNRDEIRRLIRETEPPRPSTRFSTLTGADRAAIAQRRCTNPERLPLLLSGELDWIVMKALEKNRARRYDGPVALAEDIGRHLRNEPVTARPPGRLYRVRKFARRNQLGVTAVAAIALTMVAGTAISIAQAVRATRAEGKASVALTRLLDERARADDLLAFMFDDLPAPLAKIGELRVLDRVIEKAIAYFASHDAHELDDRTLVKHVTALNKLGGLRMDTARYMEAELAYREALDRAVVLVTRNPRDARMLWARGEAEWGNGFVRYRQGRISDAREWFNRESATRAALVALEPANVKWQIEFAKQQHNLAALMRHEDPEFARRSFLEELAALEKLLPTAPDPVEVQGTIATANLFLGVLAEDAGKYAEAEQRYARQTKVLEEIARAKPGDSHWQYKVGDSLTYQADICAIQGRRDEAGRHLERAANSLRPLVTQDSLNQRWRKSMVLVDLKQAQLIAATGDHTRAAELAANVRRELEALATKESTDVGTQHRLATILRLEATIEHARGAAEAANSAARAIQVSNQLVGRPNATSVHRATRAAAGLTAGQISRAQGNESAARAHWQQAQSAIQASAPNSHDWRIVDPAARLAHLLGEKERAAALVARLTAFGYVPLEPWP